MARIRTIKPGAFLSLSLASCDIEARYLFHGLLTMADDSGRMPDHPALIRSQVFPLDDLTAAQVDTWLDQLVKVESVCRYAVHDTRLLHLPNFNLHQVINRPTPSRLAPCPAHPVTLPRPRDRAAELLGDQ